MNRKIKKKGITTIPKKIIHIRTNSDTNNAAFGVKNIVKELNKKILKSKEEHIEKSEKEYKKNHKKKIKHRRTVSEQISLLPLQGNIQQKAPKIYKNQWAMLSIFQNPGPQG